MRFYVLAIQYNKEKEAENRTAPKAFDTLNKAKAEYHAQLTKDYNNATLGWSLVMIIDSNGRALPEYTEKYVADVETPIMGE